MYSFLSCLSFPGRTAMILWVVLFSFFPYVKSWKNAFFFLAFTIGFNLSARSWPTMNSEASVSPAVPGYLPPSSCDARNSTACFISSCFCADVCEAKAKARNNQKYLILMNGVQYIWLQSYYKLFKILFLIY